MRFLLSLAALITIILMLNLSSNPVTQQAWAAPCQSIAVPAYFYPNPTTYWDQAFSAAPTLGLLVVNPASGPGTTVDGNYASVITRGREQGVRLYGYVASGYGTRTLPAMQAEIDKWKTMYGLTDIFIDEVTTDTGHIPYYQSITNYVKTKTPSAKTIANPGTVPDEGYVNVADIIIVFEGAYTTFNSFQFPSWFQNYPAAKFWQLIYSVPNAAAMQLALTRTAQLNAGHVYITHDILPNPWDSLPPYWNNEVSAVAAGCAVPQPSPTPTSSPVPTSTATPIPPTSTPTSSPVSTSTATPVPILPPSPTPTNSPVPTNTPLPTPTNTSIPTQSPTPTPSVDTTQPAVAIYNPLDNSNVSRNSTVVIRANASDNVGIRRVEFYVNDSLICTDRNAPYNCSWDVPSRRDRVYTLRAEAIDIATNTRSSTIVVTSR